ncbi:uncharacterized protein DUF4184 [Actinocorallia herbida]|uniref:Uncharacterized protein DUF4184 n=1 Tax=Actinocorallia herbida TaxID=58109 RepID=A0A3N1D0B1_9ACTN|nr:DUF4184 family protein [Actinocorallia herbida]ROO86962.1 uncharacterized protein DUF4184 [Actinocorallia herbida]
MPLTFPSHAAVVLPLKMRWPRRFDGVALVVGSAVPDLPYALGRPLLTYGHTWAGLVVWGVPLSMVAALLVRRAAPVAAAHLPGWSRDYGVLGGVRHRWYVTASSALVGAVSHRLWDDVTHAGLPGTSMGYAALGEPVVDGIPWWFVLHGASTVLGLAGWAWATVLIGRRGLLREWHGPPPETVRRPRRFWTVLAGILVTGSIASVLLPYGDVPVNFMIRALVVSAFAVIVAAQAVELTGARAPRMRIPPARGGYGAKENMRNAEGRRP